MKKVSMGSFFKISSKNSKEEPHSSAISARRPEQQSNVGGESSPARCFNESNFVFLVESPVRKPTISRAALCVGHQGNISSSSSERWRVSATATDPSRVRAASCPQTGCA